MAGLSSNLSPGHLDEVDVNSNWLLQPAISDQELFSADEDTLGHPRLSAQSFTLLGGEDDIPVWKNCFVGTTAEDCLSRFAESLMTGLIMILDIGNSSQPSSTKNYALISIRWAIQLVRAGVYAARKQSHCRRKESKMPQRRINL